MMIRDNPVIDEGRILLAEHPRITTVYRSLLVIGAFVLFVFWPGGDFVRHFTAINAPVSFAVLSTVLLPLVALTAGVFGIERVAPEQFLTIGEWVERIGVESWTVLWSKLFVGAVHTVALVLLPAPLLVLSAAPSATVSRVVPFALLLLLTSSLTTRAAGVAALFLFPRFPPLRRGSLAVFSLLFWGLSLRLWPAVHPLVALLGEPGGGFWYAQVTAGYHRWTTPVFHVLLTAALVGVAAGGAWLEERRRKHAIGF